MQMYDSLKMDSTPDYLINFNFFNSEEVTSSKICLTLFCYFFKLRTLVWAGKAAVIILHATVGHNIYVRHLIAVAEYNRTVIMSINCIFRWNRWILFIIGQWKNESLFILLIAMLANVKMVPCLLSVSTEYSTIGLRFDEWDRRPSAIAFLMECLAHESISTPFVE